MRSVQIKNVPDDVHSVLRQRAAAAGQSLQEYLLALLTEHAGRPTMAELTDRIRARPGVHLEPGEAAAIIREVRDAADR